VTHPHGLNIVHRVAIDRDRPFAEFLREMEGACRDHGEAMVIAAEPEMKIPEIMSLLEFTDSLDLPAKVLSSELEVLVSRARMPCDMILGVPLVHFEAPSVRETYALAKRVVSVLVAAVTGVVLFPLMGLIAVCVRLTSSGPALFIQKRIGVNRRPFKMYKFRTMYERADEIQAQLEEFNESGDGLFKIRNDPRVTPLGKLLRRLSLDELPQLINILRGEMVLVGPRPLPRRDFENYYEDWHYGRHGGLPGLTCLWQVSGRSDLDFHSMCILDVYYLRNQNWVLDIRIILRTVWVVLFAKGAY
jgi:lipopolysaccharide/colanic/teichoic acid biosynthesis glycosyltransferase